MFVLSKFIKKMFMVTAAFSVVVVGGYTVEAATYQIDPSHSSIGFAVKHLEISTTKGAFNDFSGTITYDPENMKAFGANVTIQTASIDTANEKRDNHLRSDDFLNVEAFPTITFKGKEIRQLEDLTEIVGDLTIRDVTKEITIPATISGPVEGMGGKNVMAISGETFINRKDFNVSWSKMLDKGGLVVSDIVNLVVEIEASEK